MAATAGMQFLTSVEQGDLKQVRTLLLRNDTWDVNKDWIGVYPINLAIEQGDSARRRHTITSHGYSLLTP